MSPADSFGTAIGVGIGIGVGIEPTNSSAKLLADRVATLSELREHGHMTIEQCLLLTVVVCGQRFALQRARPESQRTPASLSIPIPIATPTPIALRRCLDSVV
ncbi:MAG: hypothetical protein N838_24215 [Thiohalocapsa sp. PB-PSB1]|nr:MAG: hypothetical protein N838_24215 [Thiohalocapsa sp. PB-PSB1]